MTQQATKHLSKVDKKLKHLIKGVGPCALAPKARVSPFHALAESIAYQQLTGKAAATIWGRVLKLYGGKYPTPEQVLKTHSNKLRAAGLSRAKVLALKDLAAKAHSGIVPTRKEAEKLSDSELIERLTAVRGVGQWTVEMFLIFTLGRPDVLPAGDYGVQKGFAAVYSKAKLPRPQDLLLFGEIWRPYRTFAAWYLWRAADGLKKARSSK